MTRSSRVALLAVMLAALGCAGSVETGAETGVPLAGGGAWVWWRTVDQHGVDEVLRRLDESGVRHIFLLVKSISGEVRETHLDELLPKAHGKGMYVHAWFGGFQDGRFDPPWMDPASEEYRGYLLEVISRFLGPRQSGRSIDGVHLDYIRYRRDAPGTAAVTSFVAEVRQLIDSVSPGTVLSAATKAEEFTSIAGVAASARAYGQEYTDLAPYVDLFCPMTYHLDYGVSPAAAVRAAANVAELTGRPVLAGIQLHEGPGGRGPTVAELQEGLRTASEAGLPGVAYFRAGMLITNTEYRETAAAMSFPIRPRVPPR